MYSNKSLPSSSEEFDLKEIAATLQRYRLSIIAIIFLGVISAVIYTMVTTKVYQADLQLQIKAQTIGESSGPQSNFLDKAFEVKGENIENEIAVIKSHFIVAKAIKRLQVGTHYYVKRGFKTTELYKDTPFYVNVEALAEPLNHYRFQIHEIDENRFRLQIIPTWKMKAIYFFRSLIGGIPLAEQPIYFDEVHEYDSPVSNRLFTITVTKTGEMGGQAYSFSLTGDEFLVALTQKALRVAVVSDKSSVVQMSYEDTIPQRAKDILNAISEVYQEQNIEIKKSSAQKTLSFIDKELDNLNSTLQESATELEGYKSAHAIIDLNDKAVMTTQKLNEVEAQRNELEMQTAVYQKLLSDIKENKVLNGVDAGSVSIKDSPLMPLIEKLQEANTNRSSLLVDYTEQHPSVVKVNKQIESLKSNIQGTIESSLRGIERRKAILNEIMGKNNRLLQEVPKEEKQLARLTNNFLLNQKNYEYLLQKRAEIAIAESSAVSTVRLIDEALVGEFPIKPIPILNIFVGLVLGLIFGMAQAFFRNYLQNTIHTITDLTNKTHLPLYGVLPYFRERKSLYEDAWRVLLTKFEFTIPKPKIITITSSVQGEGRTTSAIEFAYIIGQSGKKVIVLDMDLKGSGINKKLNLGTKGMSALLRGEACFEEVVHYVGPNTDVVVSGEAPLNSYELVISNRFEALLQQLGSEYDYIIIESPPAGLVADALVLMRRSDISLIVFKANYSKKDFIHNTNRFVEEHRLDNVGIILNGLELTKIRPWMKK